MIKKLFLILLLGTFVFIFGCGKSTSPTPEKTASDFINDGWKAFDSEDYVSAQTNFTSAITKDASSYEAFLGRAITNLLENVSYDETKANEDLMVIFNNRENVSDDIKSVAFTLMAMYKLKKSTDADWVRVNLLDELENNLVINFTHNTGHFYMSLLVEKIVIADIYLKTSPVDKVKAKQYLDEVKSSSDYSNLPQKYKEYVDKLYTIAE